MVSATGWGVSNLDEGQGSSQRVASTQRLGHAVWVRICHWTIAASVLVLGVSGFLILMVHPRLYWGQVGNDLTPAFLELPISDNHRPAGWQPAVTFSELANAPISANRTYEIFNQNGWARSLHFLAGWFLVVPGMLYVLVGLMTGHLGRDLLPRRGDFAPRALWQDLKDHLGARSGSFGAGAPYGRLQRWAFTTVALIALPFMVLTGLTMSPAVTAAHPLLLDIFGGHQSARTLHFFGFAALALFLAVHVGMVVLTGFGREMRAMIVGR
jgi:thiosulfate reductase cytochrome b subunit